MATDADVARLVGRPFPASVPSRCLCGTAMVVVGAWHPEGRVAAYVVLGCPGCGATRNGGRP